MSLTDAHAPLRILPATGSEALQQEIGAMLRAANYTIVAEVRKGEEAVRAVRELAPDVVVLTEDLSDPSGIEVVRLLKREWLAPTVLLSDHNDVELVHAAADAGVYSFLVRPVRQAALTAAIEMSCSRWRLEREAAQRMKQLEKTLTTREMVDCAKKILITRDQISEREAYRIIQRKSMDCRRSMRAVAEAIILVDQAMQREKVRRGAFGEEPYSEALSGVR